jgi:predicted outer membrane repeat protein
VKDEPRPHFSRCLIFFRRCSLSLALILVSGSLLSGTATAATLSVTTTDDAGPGSLRQAIDDANKAGGDNTVVFALPAAQSPLIKLTTGGIFVRSSIAVVNDRPGDVLVTLQVEPKQNLNYPCFYVTTSGRLFVAGLTLRGTPAVGRQDGAIRNEGGYLEVRNCTLSDNVGIFGGAIYNAGKTTLVNCLITRNSALSAGGGLYNNGGGLILQHCVISDNSAKDQGGGIGNWGSTAYVSMVDCVVSGNTTTTSTANTQGGAGLFNNGIAGMNNCTFSNNRVVSWGGGAIYTVGGLTANSCTFVNNKGEFGGAVWDYGATRQSFLSNCTFTGNTGSAAVYANYQYINSGNPKLWLNNCTFSENPSPAIISAGNGTKVDTANSIFRRGGNTANLVAFGGAVITSRGHNLSDDAAGGDGATGPGGYLNGPGDIRNTDPRLGPLADNGGPTMTFALLPGSPAIDGGDSAIAPPRDQRGLVHRRTPDIGSFELDGTVSTTRLANISTRARCLTNDNVVIAGFIISGQDNKKVILRALGASLAGSSHLNNPTLELYDGRGQLIGSNDDWGDALNRQEIIDSALAPTNELESAILTTLAPGAYTAVVRGAANSTGITVVEAYDLDPTANSRFANISTRGLVQTGDNVMIGGFIVLGPDNQTLVVRAMGPSLRVDKPLADPNLELYDSNGTVVAFSYNWYLPSDVSYDPGGMGSKVIATGLPPTNSFECALVTTLTAGQYTAIVTGFEDGTGVGLVEVYALQ